MTFILRKRLQTIDHQAAQLKRRYGKRISTWPPEARERLQRIHDRRRRVFSLMGREE